MAGTQPPGQVSDDARGDLSGPSRWWWWLVVVAVVAAVVLLVVQPWTEHQTEPDATDTASSVSDVPNPTPSEGETAASKAPAPSVTSAPPPPGARAVFDGTSLATLFVTDADLTAAVPAAASGVQPGIGAGELPWGLPEGSSVEPPRCTTSVTVVADAPDEFDARSSSNDAVEWQQRVTVLDTAADAQKAFSELVETVDACPEYSQVNPGVDGGRWTAQPAIEGQGVYPSIVQEVTATAEGTTTPGYHGHMLVGNAIVSWTASALTPGDAAGALATLGDATSLDTMVQNRAQQAVTAVS